MIVTAEQYQKAQDELRHLESWLQRLQKVHPVPAMVLRKAGIRKMIARLHEELAVYEGTQEVEQPETSSLNHTCNFHLFSACVTRPIQLRSSPGGAPA